jgi:broad specificity phosphatase PhoE
MSGMYHFFFIRHAESTGNAAKIFQGWADFPLSERGLEQARLLAQEWAREERRFDLCISSPLMRARQTAEIFAEALGVAIEFDPDWRELHNGIFAGLTSEAVGDRFSESEMTPYVHYGESGESRWQLFLRVGNALQRLMDRGPGRYLVVSHGGALNMAMYAMLGIPLQTIRGPRFYFSNLGFAEVEYDPVKKRWELKRLENRE